MNLKLQSITSAGLKEFAKSQGVSGVGTKADIVLRLIDSDTSKLDGYIKDKYKDIIRKRQKIITDKELKAELNKVTDFKWGTVQGGLDRKIQRELVRVYPRYKDIVKGIESKLYEEIKGYVLASWYNHWTTIIIEDHIALHPRVTPTLTSRSGVDIFFDEQPFDLKTTNLPKGYDYNSAINDPGKLMKWLYENQGVERFGDDNRMYVVLASPEGIEGSWRLKRKFALVFAELDKFLDSASITTKDEITFSFKRNTYTAVSKLLLITDQQ